MQEGLPKPQKNLYSIGEASRLLGVSIDTIRRWDRAGKINLNRTPGGTRLVPKEEIDRFNQNIPQKTLSVGQAAEKFGVSPQTLRRWDREGLVKASRTPGGTRQYSQNQIQEVKTGQGRRLISIPKPLAEIREQLSDVESKVQQPASTKSILRSAWYKDAQPKKSTRASETARPPIPDTPHQKAAHYIKYMRPGWYRRYHQSPIHRPLHMVILGLFLLLSANIMFGDMIEQVIKTQRAEQQDLGELLAAVTPPRVLSFQGRLTDSSDVPVTSATTIEFRIYTSTSGDTGDPCASTCLWESKTWSVTPDQNGIFSVLLGDTSQADTAIPATLFSENATLYLGVKVGSDSEMTPRQRIAAVSYALNSDALEGFHGSQSPGADEVPILNASGNLIFGGAATVGTSSSGALTLDSDSGTLILGTGTTTISSGGATLVINAAGNVDIQDALNADSITSDAGVSIAVGQSYTGVGAVTLDAGGANAIIIGSGDVTSLTVTTNSTGDTEVVLPDGSISGTEITDDTILEADLNAQGTLTDEFCLTYETGGGALFEWQSCGAGGFSGEVDDTTNNALTFTTDDATPPTGLRSIYADDTSSLIINSVTGGLVAIEINDAQEYAFSATGLEFNSNNITGVGSITGSGAVSISSASSGALTLDSDSGSLTLGAGTNTLINADAATALLINPTGDLQFQSSSNFLTSAGNLTLAGTLTVSGVSALIGSGGNTFTFDTTSGPDYAGTARPSKTITLSPEYAGAILTDYYGAGTDTSISGSMTSDTDTSQGTSIRNYYQWERTTATQHFYTVAIRITLPKDFSAWATTNALVINYITGSVTTTESDLDVRVYNENSATIVASDLDNASTSWATVVIDDSVLDDGASSEWDAADETAVIYLRMGSQSSNTVRVGDIQLNYLAKF